DPAGHLLAEVVRHPEITRDVERVISTGEDVRESVIRMGGSGRAFEVHITALSDAPPRGACTVLVLFFDITRLEALESVRREFVANVSHELRTPLTSIKAFVETLIEGRLEDRKHSLKFLKIAQKHADRMNALIDDLTDLSLIETGAITLDLRVVDAAGVAREVAEQLESKAEEREVQLEVDLEPPFAVRADRRRLEQMLLNLADNAIKFNRPGGRVRIAGSRRENRPVLLVQDDGIGIAENDREKVFHRFYRVDPDRSRRAGGTGLGLAIVKHLVRLHGGSVRVESELGGGTTFFLEFPAVDTDIDRSAALAPQASGTERAPSD
ncbi:MAG: ATP-binding protein, partial [Acidobacteriota bacterium]|nr:ATP-binding protein [Acidobacteriota bacterium]